MQKRTVATKAGGFEYEVTFGAFESEDEARGIWEAKGLNPSEVTLGIVNAQQEQNAKQGGKAPVLKALKAGFGEGDEELAAAVLVAQEYAAGYTIGAPRGGTLASGMTKTQAKDMGVSLGSRETIGQDELADILAQHGIEVV